jgi:hypothetical protein
MRLQTVRHHMKAALCILGGAWMLTAACQPPPTPPIPQATPAGLPWGAPKSLGQAESLSAPSIAFSPDDSAVSLDGTTMFAWAGADAQESRLYAQSTEMTAPTILALKVTTPLDVTIVPSGSGYFHLLWRDDVEGKPHLFYSLFNKEAVAVLDAYDLSEQPVYNFAVLSREDGSVRIVYSAGWVAEPRLFVHDIDAKGRSQFPVQLEQVGDLPVLLQDDSKRIWLFWQMEDGSVWNAQLIGTTLVDPQSVVTSPALEPGDLIMHMSIAGDYSYYRYLFWQIVRADGIPETWYAVGEIRARQPQIWSPAMRLTIPTLGDTTINVGYRVGQVTASERGADLVGWGRPLEGLALAIGIVPIAVQIGDVLGIAYLQKGNIIGYQRLARVGEMISAPILAGRSNGSLLMTWAEVSTEAAQLSWLQSTP